MPATPQTESETKPVAVFWISCFEHISFAIGETVSFIVLSVVSSVQCCIVMSGTGEPTRCTFISHRPALRTGNSTAPASLAGPSARRGSAKQNERSCRAMSALLLTSCFQALWAGSVERAQRLCVGAIGHPAAGERDVSAVIGLHGEEFHHL